MFTDENAPPDDSRAGHKAERCTGKCEASITPASAADQVPLPDAQDVSATLQANIDMLAGLDLLTYERMRTKAAEDLGLRVGMLDTFVNASRADKNPPQDTADESIVEVLEPWHERVDGLDLLNAIHNDFSRYLVAEDWCKDAAAIWCLGTYAFDAFHLWPRLFFTSPEKQCGKTVALEIIEANVNKGLMVSSISTSALFRVVEAHACSVIMDEADTIAKDDEGKRMFLNSGHRKRSAKVVISEKVGETFEPRVFSTWAPIAIACIGSMWDTVMDRSVIVHLARKGPGESVERKPKHFFEHNRDRRRQCLRWAHDNAEKLRQLRVEVPHHGNDRAQDNFEPLFVLAETVGSDWPKRISTAFTKASAEEDTESLGAVLLRDIREAFDSTNRDRIFSDDLVKILNALEERPWGDLGRGAGLTTNGLARRLKPYRIKSKSTRIGHKNLKGYLRPRFNDAFDRFLGGDHTPNPLDPPQQGVTTSQPSTGAACEQIPSVTAKNPVTFQKSRKPSTGAGCDVVTLQNPPSRANGGIDTQKHVECSACSRWVDHDCEAGLAVSDPHAPRICEKFDGGPQ